MDNNQTNNGNTNFPTGVTNHTYQGLGPGFNELLTQLFPDILKEFSGFQDRQPGLFDEARGNITSGYGDARNNLTGLFDNKLAPALQQQLNSLGSRNMINSSVAGDAMSKTATGVADQMQSRLAALSLEEQKALAGITSQQAGQSGQYAGLLTNLLGAGRYSETNNDWQPYSDQLNFLSNQMR